MIKQLLTYSAILLFAIQVYSQNPEILFSAVESEYPNDIIVQIEKKLHYKLEINNNKLEIFLIEKNKMLFLKNPSGINPSQSLYTSVMRELIEFEANSYIPNGKKYKKIPVKEYKEKMNIDSYSFYDDIKELSFTFPGIAKGTIIEINSIHKINEPRLLPPLYLKSYIPIRNFEIIIESDVNVDYELLFQNNASEMCDFSVQQSKKNKIMSCTLTNLDKIISEDQEPGLAYFEPHFIPKINSYTIKGEEIEILKDINSLYSWYYSLTKDLTTAEIAEPITLLADSLTKDCTTEFEEVKTLYYWIQTNIKYIAFEYGLGGFVPREAEVTFRNKYGDCKDKTLLLFTLLKARGITSHISWIGTYSLPYSYKEVPTTNSDNHMIITYISDGEYYFLDGTNHYHNIFLPSQFIQGKEALISKGENDYEIKKVPVQPSSVSQYIDSVNLEINEQSIFGSGNFSISGYHKTNMSYSLENRSEEIKKRIIEESMLKGNNKFVLEEYTMSKLENFEPVVMIDYTFSLNDYIQQIDNNLYLNLNLDKGWLDFKTKKDRKHPLLLIYATTTSNQYKLKMPDNYTVEFLPEKVSYKNDHFYFHINYRINENIIYYDHIATADILIVDKETLPEWTEFIKELEKAYKQTILIKKND